MTTYKPTLYFKDRPFSEANKFKVHSMNSDGMTTYYKNRISPTYDFIPYHPQYLKYHKLENEKAAACQRVVDISSPVFEQEPEQKEEQASCKAERKEVKFSNYPEVYDRLRQPDGRSKKLRIGKPYASRSFHSNVGFTLHNLPKVKNQQHCRQVASHWDKLAKSVQVNGYSDEKEEVIKRNCEENLTRLGKTVGANMFKSSANPVISNLKDKKQKYVIAGHLARTVIKVPYY